MSDQDKPPVDAGQSIVSKMIEQEQERKRQEAIVLENIEEYKSALNSIAAGSNGLLVFKKLIKYLGVFEPERYDPARMVETAVKRQVYLTMIRPYLDPTLKAQLEE